MKLAMMMPSLNRETGEVGIAARLVGTNEGTVIPLLEALSLRDAISKCLEQIIEQAPTEAAETVKKDLHFNCECPECSMLLDFLQRIAEQAGICPHHGVKLDSGCPLCEQELG